MIAGILLAAGKSSRFGACKLLQPLPDGDPVGVRAARNLLSALPFSLAVVRPGDHLLASKLEACGIRIVVNPHADGGMGHSLACGVGASREADGWLIALADMPFIHPLTIRSIARLISSGEVIALPRHAGKTGHPVGFGRSHLHRLLQLTGDQGGRAIVRENREQAVILDVADSGILTDIDHPDQLPR